MPDPHELIEAVCDEDSFVRFVTALRDDWNDEREKEASQPSSPYGAGANGWENGTIGAFLDAATTWATTSRDGLEYYSVPANPWRRCADILLMGKLYE